jgi:hypothetical protein
VKTATEIAAATAAAATAAASQLTIWEVEALSIG